MDAAVKLDIKAEKKAESRIKSLFYVLLFFDCCKKVQAKMNEFV